MRKRLGADGESQRGFGVFRYEREQRGGSPGKQDVAPGLGLNPAAD